MNKSSWVDNRGLRKWLQGLRRKLWAMLSLNLKANYPFGVQAKCQAQATGLSLLAASGCVKLPWCQLIGTQSSTCFSPHRQKLLCHGAGGLWTWRSLRTKAADIREGNSLPAGPRESKRHPFRLWDIKSGATDTTDPTRSHELTTCGLSLAALARCLRPRAGGKCEFMQGGKKRMNTSSRKDQPETAEG